MKIKQGEIYEVYLDPVKGSEQAGRRPAVVVSGNLANDNLNTVIVCPLTSQLKNYYGNLILEAGYPYGITKKSEVMTIHIRAITKERLQKRLGTISKEEIAYLKDTLAKILTY